MGPDDCTLAWSETISTTKRFSTRKCRWIGSRPGGTRSRCVYHFSLRRVPTSGFETGYTNPGSPLEGYGFNSITPLPLEASRAVYIYIYICVLPLSLSPQQCNRLHGRQSAEQARTSERNRTLLGFACVIKDATEKACKVRHSY